MNLYGLQYGTIGNLLSRTPIQYYDDSKYFMQRLSLFQLSLLVLVEAFIHCKTTHKRLISR